MCIYIYIYLCPNYWYEYGDGSKLSVAPITLDGFASKIVFVLIKTYFSSVVLQILYFGPCPQYVVPWGSSLTFEKEVQLMILGVSHTFTMEVFDNIHHPSKHGNGNSTVYRWFSQRTKPLWLVWEISRLPCLIARAYMASSYFRFLGWSKYQRPFQEPKLRYHM